MTRTEVQPSHTINVLKMLQEHLPGRYRELQVELEKMRKREQEIRDELSRIEKHAAVESIDLTPRPVEITTSEPPHAES